MIDPTAYHTVPFKAAAQKLRVEVDRVKDEAVAKLGEEPHQHPYRIGRIKGLELAAEILREIEREMLNIPKKS